MRAQNDLRRAAALGDFFAWAADTGGFRFMPCALADARPLALSPPAGFFPSLRCHAGVLATACPHIVNQVWVWSSCFFRCCFRCRFFRWGKFLRFLVRVLSFPYRFFHGVSNRSPEFFKAFFTFNTTRCLTPGAKSMRWSPMSARTRRLT